MNILFVCKYNRFRSRIAEALFRHYNANKSIIVKSAGTDVNQLGFPILKGAAKVLQDLKIDSSSEQGAQQITPELISWADKIYVVADDAPLTGLPKDKTEQIDIPDSWRTEEEILGTIGKIERYIKKVIKELT